MCINQITVNKWIEAKSALDAAKRLELQLRNKVIADMKERNPAIEEGTSHHQFKNIDVAVSYKMNKSVDAEVLSAVWDKLSEAEQSVFTYKPTLNTKQYNELKDSKLICSIITTKPAQASVSFKLLEEA